MSTLCNLEHFSKDSHIETKNNYINTAGFELSILYK